MNRWNEFYDRMTPKKTYLKNTQTSRKTDASLTVTTNTQPAMPGKLKNRTAAAASESYIKRRDDVGTVSHNVSNKTDSRPNDGNFAWVD